jgi:hypothetical protein
VPAGIAADGLCPHLVIPQELATRTFLSADIDPLQAVSAPAVAVEGAQNMSTGLRQISGAEPKGCTVSSMAAAALQSRSAE